MTTMCAQRERFTEEADNLRRDRIESLLRGEIFAPIDPAVGYMVHVLPLGRFDSSLDLDSRRLALGELRTLGNPVGFETQFNVDGLAFLKRAKLPVKSHVTHYTQWLRFGGVEGYVNPVWQRGPTRNIHAQELTAETVRYVRAALEIMRRTLSLDPPFAALLSLVGAKGARFVARVVEGRPFDSDRILAPPEMFEDHPETPDAVPAVLRPALDVLWRAAGFRKAPDNLEKRP